MPEFEAQLRAAREQSWASFGRKLTVYLPGMFISNGIAGGYPAVSITGAQCELGCEHCRGALLKPMHAAVEPNALVRLGLQLAAKGARGLLVSGGCDASGRLPWRKFIPALRELKAKTSLHISVHAGLLDVADAHALKAAGVDQALLDVVGSDATYRQVLHLPEGCARLRHTLDALTAADLPFVPHLICGLHFGSMQGEAAALDMLASLRPPLLVVVALMPLPGTPMQAVMPPAPQDIARILVEARQRLPHTEISLGCARPRGGRLLERLAIDAGVNRMALPSEEALAHAAAYGLAVEFRRSCCAVVYGPPDSPWLEMQEGQPDMVQ